MKKKYILLSTLIFLLCLTSLCGCGLQKGYNSQDQNNAWQNQYDLGIQYLEKADFDAAITAFSAAIELNPAETASYIALSQIYLLKGEHSLAEETLAQKPKEIAREVVRNNRTDGDDGRYWTEERDAKNRLVREVIYEVNGDYGVFEYNEDEYFTHTGFYHADGTPYYIDEYDGKGNLLYTTNYLEDGSYTVNHVNSNRMQLLYIEYNNNGTVMSYTIFQYDESGNDLRHTTYDADGSILTVIEFNEQGQPIYEEYCDADGTVKG